MIQLVKPCRGSISQLYGNKQSHNGLPHTGNDYRYYGGPGGTVTDEVFAAASGVVVYAGDARALGWPNPYHFNPDFDRTDKQDSSAGNVLVLRHVQHGRAFFTTYSHLESWKVRKGDPVRAGQHIAVIGNTGFSFGKHLHFELIFLPSNFNTATYGRSDPNPYFSTGLAAAGTTTPTTTAEDEEEDMGHVDTISDAAAKKVAEHVMNLDYTTDEGKPGKLLWVLRSLGGILASQAEKTAAAVAGHNVPWYGWNGVRPTEGRTTTTLANAAGFADTLAAEHARELAIVKATVQELAVLQGVTIDYQAIAKAVVDEEAKRLSGTGQ